MRDEAERYCSLIERADSFGREAFVAELAESLAGLLAAAPKLPDVSPTDDDLPDVPPQEQVRERFVAVSESWASGRATGRRWPPTATTRRRR
jgi:hypothetical protein